MRIDGPFSITGVGPIEIYQGPRHPNDYVVVDGFHLNAARGDYGYIDGRDSYVVMDGQTYRPQLINGTYYLDPERGEQA